MSTRLHLAMKTQSSSTYMLLLSMLLVTSCHPGVVVDWLNNSGQDLVVVTINARSEETTYAIKKNRVLRTGIPVKLRIEHNTGSWHYEPPTVPERFWRSKNAMVSVISLQIEKDGSIYVLQPGTRGPVTNFPAQPVGYPLHEK
jgi:hypothetical protein